MTKEFLPYIRIFFEVLIYTMFPIFVLLLLLSGAPMIFYNYIQAVVWVQSWGPVYAVLHFLTTFYQKGRINNILAGDINQGGISYSGYNIAKIHDVMASSSAVIDYMTILVPFISWLVLKGFQNLVHMAGSMLQPAIGAASSAATETTGDNIGLGNMHFRNVAHDTYGAFNSNSELNISNAHSIQRDDMAVERFGNDSNGESRAIDYSKQQ